MVSEKKAKEIIWTLIICIYKQKVYQTKNLVEVFFHISLEEMKKLQGQIRDVTVPVRKKKKIPSYLKTKTFSLLKDAVMTGPRTLFA